MSIQTTLIAAGVALVFAAGSVATIKHEHNLLVQRDGHIKVLDAELTGAYKAFAEQTAARTAERNAARAALDAAAKTCDARVAATRRTTTAIKTIVEKPHATAANHCPVPELVPSGELRDALQPGS